MGSMAMAEADGDALERMLPMASGEAFAAARARVLQSGQSVLQSEGGCIYEVYPTGKKVLVKQIEPPITVVSGRIYSIG